MIRHTPECRRRFIDAADPHLTFAMGGDWESRVHWSCETGCQVDAEWINPPPSDSDVSPGLLDALRALGDSYGPLGVARVACSLTDPAAVFADVMCPRDDRLDDAPRPSPWPPPPPDSIQVTVEGGPAGDFTLRCSCSWSFRAGRYPSAWAALYAVSEHVAVCPTRRRGYDRTPPPPAPPEDRPVPGVYRPDQTATAGGGPMTQADDRTPVVMRGYVGWGNRKGGVEAYGPGGRWGGEGPGAKYGDLLGDALERAGCHEGTPFLVVAIPSRFAASDLDGFEEAVREVINTREKLADAERSLGRLARDADPDI